MDFKELKRLHDLGFALHWLRPESKVPAQAGWTKGERQSFDALKASYRKGMNIGARLGAVSKIEEKFLAVLDVDVKSKDEKHQKEAYKALFEKFPKVKNAAFVKTGRGNGSAHYYVLTDKPFSGGDRQAASNEIVEVLMPSTPPSKKEIETLSPEKISNGFRLRPAWEISFMSEGRQVALPGSIHPDTKRPYTWGREIEWSDFDKNLFLVSKGAAQNLPDSNKNDLKQTANPPAIFDFTLVDASKLGLRKEQLDGLTNGDGVQDRSAYAFSLCMALLQRKVPEAKIISLLTDKNYWLGHVGFDHAKTQDRKRAAIWVEKYCLRKAKEKVNQSLFENEIVEINGASPEKITNLNDEPWKKELSLTPAKNGGLPKIKPTFHNLLLILENEVSFELIRRNLFTLEDIWQVDAPWGTSAGDKRSGGIEDALKVRRWFATEWEIDAPTQLIEEVLLWLGGANAFHPIKEMLEGLEWDGVERLDNAFKTYLGATMPEPYLTEVTRKFFLALMKRIYEPGCKFDHVPVFEGKQGIGKSSFGSILVGHENFMDGLPDLGDKDAALNLQGIWLVEMSELSSLYKSQLEITKAFISRRTDKVRPPYGKRRVDLPRQCVFLGTTNSKDYLVDETGNRRYWPIQVHQVDFKKLKKDRKQLLAEAKFLYDFCDEDLWLSGKALKQAETIQALRVVEDEGDSMLSKFLNFTSELRKKNKDFSSLVLEDLFDFGPWSLVTKTVHTRKKAASILRREGYERIHTRSGKRWVLKDEW